MTCRAFYNPADMDTLLTTLGFTDLPRAKAPDEQACVFVPTDPRPFLDPVKTVTELPDGTFLVCDPTMQMVELPISLEDASLRLAEAGVDNLAKDILLTGEDA